MTLLMREGTISDRVAHLQRFLVAAGHYDGRIDGLYGSVTARGVRELQTSLGVRATGELDDETMATLRGYLGQLGRTVSARQVPREEG